MVAVLYIVHQIFSSMGKHMTRFQIFQMQITTIQNSISGSGVLRKFRKKE